MHRLLRPPLIVWLRYLLSDWQQRLPAIRHDRWINLAPLAAVLLFLAAIVLVFTFLRLEEIELEKDALRTDVEYAQQRLRMRLMERQEQFLRVARELSSGEMDLKEFRLRAETLIAQYPELYSVSWIDAKKTVLASLFSPALPLNWEHAEGELLQPAEALQNFNLTRSLGQPVYTLRSIGPDGSAPIEMQIPLTKRNQFLGSLMVEYSVEGLLRYGIPSEISARYALTLNNAEGLQLAGSQLPKRTAASASLVEVPVSPVGTGLLLSARAYRTSLGVIGSGMFWVVVGLSGMTAWMLIGNWRHTRKRLQAQKALIEESNFRRAMENSMPTGMRALDLQGRITYVNAAFCQMTGWSESELVGTSAPFPYWPHEDREYLSLRLEDELKGRISPGGFQIRVKRKNDTIFDARIYISPLIDAQSLQTGWMTSMTDITEPNRIREQLASSYERFTTVLEALDASVSVVPLGTDELLFTNKMYRLWFGTKTEGHRRLAASKTEFNQLSILDAQDSVDNLAGMPASNMTEADSERNELYIEHLNLWIEVRSRYLTWVDGRLAQMLIGTDITTRRLAEEAAAEQAERAQTASRLITMGEMASSVAHELNQPLTAINNYCTGMLGRIRAGQINPEDLMGALEKTARQAQRAGQIIQRIRDFVKRSEPKRVVTEVSSMLEEALELVGIELRRHNIRLRTSLARTPRLLVDPILIEQVLVNLLKNSVESIVQAQRPLNNRLIDVRVFQALVDGLPVVEFEVQDTGSGIEQDVAEKLFEAFHTTKSNGLGIGLNLCRSIVESHQGRMKAENIYNGLTKEGCRFSFWIPLTDPASAANTTGSNNTQNAQVMA
jgi:PAS domain S-box-containing protein